MESSNSLTVVILLDLGSFFSTLYTCTCELSRHVHMHKYGCDHILCGRILRIPHAYKRISFVKRMLPTTSGYKRMRLIARVYGTYTSSHTGYQQHNVTQLLNSLSSPTYACNSAYMCRCNTYASSLTVLPVCTLFSSC